MKETIFLTVSALLYTIITTIIFFRKDKINKVENRIFKRLLATSILSMIMELLIVPTVDIEGIATIVQKLFLICLVLWLALFMTYTFVVTTFNENDTEKKNINKYNLLYYIFIVINVFICALILILPIEFNSIGNSKYTSGPAVNVIFVTLGIYVSIMSIMVITHIKKIHNKGYIPIIALIILLIAVGIIQKIYPEMLLSNAVFGFIIYLMYHTIENPDLKMIEQLNIAKTQAEKANQAKSDFLSSMSHEIRTPLNAIVGFSECIKNADTLEEAKENATDVITASNTLLEIVNGILDISKIESGKLELVQTDYSTQKLFYDIEKLIQARIGDKPIDFKVEIAPDIPSTLYGDHTNVKKIIINLLTNAVKYTDSGLVTLNVKCVKTNNDICRLIISVKDTGRGIKRENIDKLFTKFQRLDEDRNTTIEGTGLGLAITKQLVEMMNGNIVVNSIYGEGSNFTVAIDQRLSLKNITVEKEKQITNLNLNNKKVLVVDDNKLNLKVAKKLLSQYNLNIYLCESGFECLEKIKNGNYYDLILLDDMMPKMRGTETLEKLKELPNFNIPTIALTANAISGMKEHYLRCGFNDYLSKPIERQELYTILTKYLTNTEEKTITNSEEIISSNANNQKNISADLDIEYQDYSDKKVLIVDDNKINIKIATKTIEPYKFEIDTAMSGLECLEKVKNNHYDLIFMDYMMPEMDGIETLKLLKKLPNFNTKVIALTADAVSGTKEKFLNAGFDEYVPKPIDKKFLNDVIVKLLLQNDIKLNHKVEKEIPKSQELYQNIPSELLNMDKPLDEIKVNIDPTGIEIEKVNKLSSMETKTIDFLKSHNIDVDKSIELLGDIDTYNDTLKEFLSNIDERVNKLKNFLKEKDMANYAIEVHALKSDSKYLGFTELAKISLEQEMKSKENDIDYITSNFEKLMIELNNVLEIVKQYI